MPVSVADGLQSKEDSVRSDAADVWTHSSLLFWKGVFGVGIDEELMFSWFICGGIYNCSLLCCCSAVRMYGMWKAVSLELFWSNILLLPRHSCFRIILRIPNMLKSCCDVLKKTTDLNRFSTGFPGDHVEIMLFSCGFERWERPLGYDRSKIELERYLHLRFEWTDTSMMTPYQASNWFLN